MKKLLLSLLLMFCLVSFAANPSKPTSAKNVEYYFVLCNDGCYHLFRVVIVGSGPVQLEFWQVLNELTWTGTLTLCPFGDDFESVC